MPTQRVGTGVSAEFVDAQNAGLVDGIYSGEILAQLVPALSVRSVSLTVIRSGVKEIIPDQTVVIGAPPGVGLVRVDMIQWNGTTLNAKAGTAAALSSADAPTPDVGFIPLALTLVFNGDATIRNMGFLDSSSASKGRIYAYYFARRGIYAASQSAQDFTTVATNFDDPEVALPIYHPRSSVVKIKSVGCIGVSGNFGGLQGTIRFDGTLITRSQARQQFNAPTISPESLNMDQVESTMPRAGVASGAHRWVSNWVLRATGGSLTYRFMELEEIL